MIVSLESLWHSMRIINWPRGKAMVEPADIDASKLPYGIRTPLTGRSLRLSR
jgi:hypothetical protein